MRNDTAVKENHCRKNSMIQQNYETKFGNEEGTKTLSHQHIISTIVEGSEQIWARRTKSKSRNRWKGWLEEECMKKLQNEHLVGWKPALLSDFCTVTCTFLRWNTLRRSSRILEGYSDGRMKEMIFKRKSYQQMLKSWFKSKNFTHRTNNTEFKSKHTTEQVQIRTFQISLHHWQHRYTKHEWKKLSMGTGCMGCKTVQKHRGHR